MQAHRAPSPLPPPLPVRLLLPAVRTLQGSLPLLEHDIHERRTDDTRRNGNHGNTYQADDAAQRPSESSDGIDVAITHRGEGHNGPPTPVADVGKRFGLGAPLDIIHQDARETEHDATGGISRDKLFADLTKHIANEPEGARIADQLEDNQHISQYHQMDVRSVLIEIDDDKRQNGYKVDNAVERKHILQARLPCPLAPELKRRGDEAEQILDGKDKRSHIVEAEKLLAVRSRRLERAEDDRRYGTDDEKEHEILKPFAHQLPVYGVIDFYVMHKGAVSDFHKPVSF